MKLLTVSILVALAFASSSSAEERWKTRGAKVPFAEVEAEHAHHNGQVIGNDRTYTKLSSEASGRRAVTLSAVGQFVEFTMPVRANSLVLRTSIPDSPDGKW